MNRGGKIITNIVFVSKNILIQQASAELQLSVRHVLEAMDNTLRYHKYVFSEFRCIN